MGDLIIRLFVGVLIFVLAASSTLGAQQAERMPQEFRDAATGVSALDLVRRAFSANGDLAAARFDVERAKGRLRQAGLFPNPTLDVEQTSGKYTGSRNEKEFIVGITLPVELGGKRGKRLDVARAELEAAEAEVADRERRLAAEVRSAYADALAALGELEMISELNGINLKTIQVVQVRVNEGDAAPLELNLLQADEQRFRSRRAVVQGRLEAAVLRLKYLTGTPSENLLLFGEDLAANTFRPPVASLQQSIDAALASRPDLRLARLIELVAEANLKLAKSQAVPDIAVFGRYILDMEEFDTTPVGPMQDRDKLLSFGASITLPFRNRNQGNLMESNAAISQAKKRREFLEAGIRSEVASAYARYEAARAAVGIFQQGVLNRNASNVDAVRGAYELGEFRVTDLLAQQRRSFESQFEYIEALAETYRALADLQAAIAAPIN
jgi:cobalt-zinc-cadmium efflux system outer membrane protein